MNDDEIFGVAGQALAKLSVKSTNRDNKHRRLSLGLECVYMRFDMDFRGISELGLAMGVSAASHT